MGFDFAHPPVSQISNDLDGVAILLWGANGRRFDWYSGRSLRSYEELEGLSSVCEMGYLASHQ